MSKMRVDDMFHVAGRGLVLTGTCDAAPKLGPASLTNPDGTYHEFECTGLETFALPRLVFPNPIGVLVRGIARADICVGAIVRLTPK